MNFSFPDPWTAWGRLWRGFFWGPSRLYEGLAWARAQAYARGILETARVPVPVFCVGNLTVGGSGKTPGVLWLLAELKKRGHRPAVVSRGYGRRSRAPVLLVPNAGETLPAAEAMGDEPRLLARRAGVPVAVGADRARTCERAWEEFKPDCLVMDDGFQHFRMYRDRDLVCLDARLAHRVFLENLPTPILPAGPWREGPAALERAHLVLLTRAERLPADKLAALQDRLRALNRWVAAAHGFLTFSDHRTGETFPAERLEDASLLALSGLADAGGFEEALLRLGAKVAGERHGDHHFFSTEEQSAALDRARREERRIVITEKDRERLPEDFPALVARLEWRVKEEAQWAPVIDSVFS